MSTASVRRSKRMAALRLAMPPVLDGALRGDISGLRNGFFVFKNGFFATENGFSGPNACSVSWGRIGVFGYVSRDFDGFGRRKWASWGFSQSAIGQ